MRKYLWIPVVAGLLAVGPTFAAQKMSRKDAKVLQNATEVLEALTTAPDQGIPDELLERAECVMVFPNVVKGAFIVGGRYGRGVVACRDANDRLGEPAFFSIGGASIGWQWGGKSTDFVMLVMNEDGMKNLLQDNVTIGGEASAAIGPVGRSAEAATDAQLQAQMLSWSRTKGLFAGASLQGAVVQPSEDANARMYGRKITASEILMGKGSANAPAAADAFLKVARNVTERGESQARR